MRNMVLESSLLIISSVTFVAFTLAQDECPLQQCAENPPTVDEDGCPASQDVDPGQIDDCINYCDGVNILLENSNERIAAELPFRYLPDIHHKGGIKVSIQNCVGRECRKKYGCINSGCDLFLCATCNECKYGSNICSRCKYGCGSGVEFTPSPSPLTIERPQHPYKRLTKIVAFTAFVIVAAWIFFCKFSC